MISRLKSVVAAGLLTLTGIAGLGSLPVVAQGHAPPAAAHAARAHRGGNHHRKHHRHRRGRHRHGGIPQHNGGDHDADNNGGPSDGDGNV